MSTRRTIILSKPSSHGAVGASSVTMSPNSSASSTTSSSGDLDEFLVRRGKKRHLDHLTWEEKVQRKKLKNRVAAQTSRDRKKQKMDEMEDNLSQVTEENEQLRADYRSMESDNAKLRLQNDDLQQQVERLRRQLSEQEQQLADRDQQLALLLKTRDLQVKIEEEEERAEGEALPDSVETKASVADIALKTGSAAGFVGGPDEDVLLGLAGDCALPALQDLLEASDGGEGDRDEQPGSPVFDLRSWEELAETLLADISRQMAGDAAGGGEPVAPHAGALPPLLGQLVGPGPEGMEPARKSRSVTHDHAYLRAAAGAGRREEEATDNQRDHSALDLEQQVTMLIGETENKMPEPMPIDSQRGEEQIITEMDKDMVFGSYDEDANCITLFATPDEQRIDESPVDSKSSPKTANGSWSVKSVAAPLQPCLSPLSSLSLMESGYESLGSPASDIWSNGAHAAATEGLDELWNDSFSELFPSLV